jgi:cytochrome c-type biogenesis protein CcmH
MPEPAVATAMAVSAPAPAPASPARWRARVGPLLLVLVAGVALAIGGGLGRSSPPSNQARIHALEAIIRCPSCEDLSVAESSSSAAVAARHQIAAMVAAGRSDQQIEQSFVARYSATILLRPGTGGLIGLVWLIPALAGAAALCVVGVLFWRRHRAFARLPSGP